MQDIQSIGGRFFGGVGGGDRRLRPHHNQNHQALKCPRCDSLNTKFCYYNNYNLSQPRHFCKSCRRYWTKGGVLRNVPVGGGCRKTKRSKPKSSSSSSPASPPQSSREPKAISNSSSESSSLTNTATATATEAVSAPSSTSSASNLLNIQHPADSKFFASQSGGGNANFDTSPTMLEQNTTTEMGMFSDMGTFTSLITASNDVPFGFTNINDISVSPFRLNQPAAQGGHQQQQQVEQSQWEQQHDQNSQELKMQEMTGGMLDQTAQVDLSVFQGKANGGGGGFGSLDWQPAGDQGLFDLPNTVDQAYWSQGQWTDQDPPSLYIP